MDVNQVLQSTLSPNDAIRQNAEEQLSQAAQANFSQYLTTLSQALGNEEATTTVRSAAGIALKNAFSSRDFNRLREIQEKWVTQVDQSIKTGVKETALRTLSSSDTRAGQVAAQFIASVAAIELPRNQWPELMPALVQNVAEGTPQQKQASLAAIGYICETDDLELRESLAQHSNAILTAVIQGARKEEESVTVRKAAIVALSDSLEFVRSNFENEGERNYIMQVVCEATQAEDDAIQQGAYGCLNRIMTLYYDKMKYYMEKALFGLTIMGMQSSEEEVAKLAVEFWCTVCEVEVSIEEENMQLQPNDPNLKPFFNFARLATPEVVPGLLQLLTKQEEDAADDDYTVSKAAYQCIQLYSQAVGSQIIQPVLLFVEANLRSEDWHLRDAAVSAFGAILEGPDELTLDPLVNTALPVLIGMMTDKNVQVKDSTAYTLGRICECVPEAIDAEQHFVSLISCLLTGLLDSPRMAASCCWALMNLADRFGMQPNPLTNPLSKHFQDSVSHILQVTERSDADNQLRTAAYEVLNAFVSNAAQDSVQLVANLSNVILERLSKTIAMGQQVVGVEDRITLEEMQNSLTSVIVNIVHRLGPEIMPQADNIMQILLQLLQSVPAKSSVPDTVFAAIGAIAGSTEEGFQKYMDAFTPFLYSALGNQEEPSLCSMAIGLVSDITRALGEKAQPYCDTFMNLLLNNLRSTTLSDQFKPAILQCFGDIAQAIGAHFETYLSVVAQVLDQAGNVTAPETSYEMVEYVTSLREGIMDAWDGIILAMKTKNTLLQQFVPMIFRLLSTIYQDPNRSEPLLRTSMGVLGDLADTFPGGDYAQLFKEDWVMAMIKETRSTREFEPRTLDTARWAREQVKRQIAAAQGQANFQS